MSCKMYDLFCIFDWLIGEISSSFRYIFQSIMNGVVSVFNAIPVPDALSVSNTYVLPESVVYWMDMLNISYGIVALVSAYSVRFLIRRIPFIG